MTTFHRLSIPFFIFLFQFSSVCFAKEYHRYSRDSVVTSDQLTIHKQRLFREALLAEKEEQLSQSVGPRTVLPENYKLQSLVALYYYPELTQSHIRFEEKNIKTTMKCVPRLDFLFRKKENRVYRICIDTKRKKKKGILLKDVPFNGQIGVIGHELGHVVDYKAKSSFGILSTGFRYLFPKYRRKLENEIDRVAIDHQLGWQVYDFSLYVFDEKNASAKYIEYKTKYYYLPQELKSLILK